VSLATIAGTLARLRRSKFRSRFQIVGRDRTYLRRHDPAILARHARRLIEERLAPAVPDRDGRQTPLRGHPVFVAQHATATCCRRCLARWHRIETGRALTADEIDYVVAVISAWLTPWRDGTNDPQGTLFDDSDQSSS